MSRALSGGAVPDLKKVMHQIVGLPRKFFNEFFHFAEQYQLRHPPKFGLLDDETMVSIKLYLPGHLILEFRLGLSYPNTAPSFWVIAPRKELTKQFDLEWNLQIEQKIDRLNAAVLNIIALDENNPHNPFFFAYGVDGTPKTTNEEVAKENGYQLMITNLHLEDINTEELSSGSEYPEESEGGVGDRPNIKEKVMQFQTSPTNEERKIGPPPPGDIPPPPSGGASPTNKDVRPRSVNVKDNTTNPSEDESDEESEEEPYQKKPRQTQKIQIRLAPPSKTKNSTSDYSTSEVGNQDNEDSRDGTEASEYGDTGSEVSASDYSISGSASVSNTQRSESSRREGYSGQRSDSFVRKNGGRKVAYYRQDEESPVLNFQAVSVPVPSKQSFLPRTARFRCQFKSGFLENLPLDQKWVVIFSFLNEHTKKTTTLFKATSSSLPKLNEKWKLVTSRPDRLEFLIQLCDSGGEVGYVKINFLALATGPTTYQLEFLNSKNLLERIGIINFDLTVEEYYKKTQLKLELTADPEADVPVSSELYCSVVHIPDMDQADNKNMRDQIRNKKLPRITSKALRKLHSTSWSMTFNFKNACLQELRKGALFITLHDHEDPNIPSDGNSSNKISESATTIRIEDIFPSGFDAAVDFRSALVARDGTLVGDLRGVVTWRGLPLLAQMFKGVYKSSEGIIGGLVIKGALQPQLRGPLHVRASLINGTISDMMVLQHDDYPDLKVPYVLQYLCDIVVTRGGLQTEGIFKNSISSPVLREVVWELEKGNFDIDLSARDAAALIKAWLRSLKEPVIPTELYAECLEAGKDAPPEKLYDLVHVKFPKDNAAVLVHLIRILRKVVKNFKYTKMPLQTLGVVMSSVLFASHVKNAPQEAHFVENLIENLDVDHARRRKHAT